MNKNIATLGIGVILTLKSLFWWGNLFPWQLAIGVGLMTLFYGSYEVIMDKSIKNRFLYVVFAWLALIIPISYTVITYEKPNEVVTEKPEVYLENGVLHFERIPTSLGEEIKDKYRVQLTQNEVGLVMPKSDSVIIDSIRFHINDKQFQNADILKTCSIKNNFLNELCSDSHEFRRSSEMFNHGNEYRIAWKLKDEINLEEVIVLTLQVYVSDTSKFVMLDFGIY